MKNSTSYLFKHVWKNIPMKFQYGLFSKFKKYFKSNTVSIYNTNKSSKSFSKFGQYQPNFILIYFIFNACWLKRCSFNIDNFCYISLIDVK